MTTSLPTSRVKPTTSSNVGDTGDDDSGGGGGGGEDDNDDDDSDDIMRYALTGRWRWCSEGMRSLSRGGDGDVLCSENTTGSVCVESARMITQYGKMKFTAHIDQ